MTPDLLDDWTALLAKYFPQCQLQRRDCATAVIVAPAETNTSERLEIDVFVHHLHNGALDAIRYQEGQTVGEGERLHGWITVRDAKANVIHHEVTCSAERFLQVMKDWLNAPQATPRELVVPALAKSGSTATKAISGIEPRLDLDVDTSLLDVLADPATALSQLQSDMACVDLTRVIAHWPLDDRARLAPRTTAVIGAYGPPTRKRQPCLLLTSNGLRDMPSWRLHLSQEFLYNHRYQWVDAPWAWSRQYVEPELSDEASATIAQARRLLAEGKIEKACALYGIHIDDRVRRLAAGLPLARFMSLPEVWPGELADALRQLAPWRLAGGLARVQAHLTAANKKPPKPGSWDRKFFWFSGQPQQSRGGLGIRIGANGAPELDIISTASNEHFPNPDWRLG